MMSKLPTPKGLRVLIEPDAGLTITPAGIIVPDTIPVKDRSGTIKAVSEKLAGCIKIGERCMYVSYEADEVTINDKTYIIIFAEHITIIPD